MAAAPPRVIALSSDRAFAKQLVAALVGTGATIEVCHAVGELGEATGEIAAALVVVHLDGELAAAAAAIVPRIAADAHVIAVVPRTDLVQLVDIMQSSDRLAAIVVADDFDAGQLTGIAQRVLSGEAFGIDKMLAWGIAVQSELIHDYNDKVRCIAELGERARAMGVRRKYREAIEKCADEMLMNAIYDAPTAAGAPADGVREAVVQYACDGKRFALAVRDGFGTLERATVLRYLHKCLHSEQQIDRKVGGAGLGLYLIASSATTVYFHVSPKQATEVICVFSLEATRLQLRQFGFFVERKPLAPAVATVAAQPRALIAVLVAAIAVTLALIGITIASR